MKTIHTTFITSLALLCSMFMNSQNEKSKDETSTNAFRFSAIAGLNFSNNYGDVDSDESFLVDFHVGAVINVPTPLNFRIQTEPQLSRVGSTYDGKTVKRFTLFDIPVLAQVYGVDAWSFEAGPKVAITIDQKQRKNEELETVNRLKRITLGLVAGATYNFDDNLFGRFRINYSPSDVIRDEAGDNEGTSILLFQLSMGYWFN